MTTFINGKAAKLRASCDACNESKVRCSQEKPKCQRCQKQGVTCIYGLSRRSHKSAPRIGESSKPTTPSSERPRKRRKNTTNSPEPKHNSINGALESDIAFGEDIASTINGMGSGLSSTNLSPDIDMFGQNDSNDILSGFDSAFCPVTDVLAEPYDFISPYDTDIMGDNMLGDFLESKIPNIGQIPSRPTCNCMSQVVKQLLSIPNSFGEDDASFDSHLSQLRYTINVLENCIYCNCISWDEMSIMTISILIGRVLQGFEAVLSKGGQYGSPPQSSNVSEISSVGKETMMAPQLFSSVLQMDPDEEDELKKHLWRIQYRKLANVLRRFNESVSRLRISQDQGATSTVHAMASRCIHVWLMQKADFVSNAYLEQDGAIVNPAFDSQEEQSLV
ncbi:hypothetical protein F4810DRAFT_54973 [Camillea tinctor]|nr:hypothetical protein F4810DRAFT_54973 [Camillea tinctor]